MGGKGSKAAKQEPPPKPPSDDARPPAGGGGSAGRPPTDERKATTAPWVTATRLRLVAEVSYLHPSLAPIDTDDGSAPAGSAEGVPPPPTFREIVAASRALTALALCECAAAAHDGPGGYIGGGCAVPAVACVLLHDAASRPMWTIRRMRKTPEAAAADGDRADAASGWVWMARPSNCCELANGNVLVTRESAVAVEVNPTQRTVVASYKALDRCLDVVELSDGSLVTTGGDGVHRWQRLPGGSRGELVKVRTYFAGRCHSRARLEKLPPPTGSGGRERVLMMSFTRAELVLLDPWVPESAAAGDDAKGDSAVLQVVQQAGVYVAFNPHVQPPRLCVSGNSGVFLLEMTDDGGLVNVGAAIKKVEHLPVEYSTARGVAVMPNGRFAVSANNSAFAAILDPFTGDVDGYLYNGVKVFPFGACSIMRSRFVVFCDNSDNQLVLCRSNAVHLKKEDWYH